MGAAIAASSPERPKAYRVIIRGGLIAGSLNLAAVFVTSALRGQSPIWVLQFFAIAALGAALQFLISTVTTAVYYAASRKLKFMVRQAIICGLAYGVVVYLFKNLIVLPLASGDKMSYSPAAVISGLIILMLCTGLPIALIVRHYSR
jgi:predicted secreted protein